ncbi:MAG TPA: hypothetical protein VJZ73_13655 [Methylomirabilota bacterium]|nr:hypothetical protein [Methylomirabilota bacterium]
MGNGLDLGRAPGDATGRNISAQKPQPCWDGVEKELTLPKYQSWPGYENNLPFVLRRYCGLWRRGF